MHPKHVPGAKVPENLENTRIYVWCVTVKAVCWLHNLLTNALNVVALVQFYPVNSEIDVKHAVAPVGRTCLNRVREPDSMLPARPVEGSQA